MAKLRHNQLAGSLKKGLAPVYLISGDEPLLVQEACDAIRQHARQAGFHERERFHVDQKFDWQQLAHAREHLSLFSEKKLIELHITNGKPGKEGSKQLNEHLQQLPDDQLLMIATPKLEGAVQRSQWVKHIESKGHWLPIWPINQAQLPQFLQQRLQQAGLRANSDAIALLAARVEGNLLAAQQEIDKLKLLADDSLLSTELVASAVADSARYNIFGLIDQALMGNGHQAIRHLNGLRAEGNEPLSLLWALAREIRTLLSIAHKTHEGQSFALAAKQAGVWDKRQTIVQTAIQRLHYKQLLLLLRQANGIDKAVKGARQADVWSELSEIVLQLSGQQSLSPANLRRALQQ